MDGRKEALENDDAGKITPLAKDSLTQNTNIAGSLVSTIQRALLLYVNLHFHLDESKEIVKRAMVLNEHCTRLSVYLLSGCLSSSMSIHE